MRIAVDATCWANPRGYGRFARELLRAMAELAPGDEFLCLGDQRAFDAWPHRLPNLRTIPVAQSVSPTLAAAADGSRSLRDMLRLTRSVWRLRSDVFFSPSVYTYFPLVPGQRSVVTIHDTMADRFPELSLPSARARLFWRVKTALAIRQADIVLTVSEYSARSIAAVHGVARSRIRVAVEAPVSSYVPSEEADVVAAGTRAGLPEGDRWFIYVGGFNPHKRVDTVLAAHAQVAAESAHPPHLLLVGSTSGDVFYGELERLQGLIRDSGVGHLVHWTGFVPDEELRHLVSGAVALLLPSECEGFGLPAVEAAACATPVIATVESPLPELLEGGGVFVQPGDVPAVARAMHLMLQDEVSRLRMGERARQRAAALTWEAAARSALQALHDAAS